jgi:signal transduction histidine kinase
MLSLSFTYIAHISGAHMAHKVGELISFGLFIAAVVIVIKNTATSYILLETKKTLGKEVQSKTFELEKKVEELKTSRNALQNTLNELRVSKNQLENHATNLEVLHTSLMDLNSELDLDPLMEMIPQRAKEVIGSRYAALGVLSSNSPGFRNFITVGLPQAKQKKMEKQPLPIGKGILGEVLKRKTPLILDDLTEEKESIGFPKDHPKMKTFLGAPIIYKDTVEGVIYLTEKKGGFSKGDAALLQAFAAGAGAAIENARLFTNLEKTYGDLLDVDRLKSDIISNVSHELRTPITISRASFELAREEDSPEERTSLFNIALNALDRLNNIVEDLISASDLQSGTHTFFFRYLDLKTVIKETIKETEETVKGKKVEVVSIVPENLPMVRADSKSLKRALVNITVNAVKFSKDEGGAVKISAVKEDTFVKISISDSGIGISAERLDSIFKPLYQGDASTTREHGGTGMGLAVAKSIIIAHEGKIWAESELGKGTTIHLTLPAQVD